MSIALQVILGLCSVVALGALICRLEAMHWRTHKPAVIGQHLGMALACLWSLGDILSGQVTVGTVGTVAGTCCWLWVSFETWASGPPAHTEQVGVPLSREMLRHVVGGEK